MSCCENARWKKLVARKSAPSASVTNTTSTAIATSVVGSWRSRHIASDQRPAETRRVSATGTRSCWTVASVAAISASLHLDAWEVRDARDRQHEDRADEVPCAIPAERAVRAYDVHAPDREPPVLHGERQHEDEAEPEFGDRVTDHAEDADPVILDASAPQGSDDAERDAHADDEDEREERELKTVRNALEDEIEGGPVVVDRVAEVEVRELPEPFRELHGE